MRPNPARHSSEHGITADVALAFVAHHNVADVILLIAHKLHIATQELAVDRNIRATMAPIALFKSSYPR